MENIFARAARFLREQRLQRRWKRLLSVLAAVVVFCTTYALILPAMTAERQTVCGMEAHTHTEECFKDGVQICGKEEHTHTEECYKKSKGITVGVIMRNQQGSSETEAAPQTEAAAKTPEQLAQELAAVVQTGNWPEDVVAAAKAHEKCREDGRAFVSAVLQYSQVQGMPDASDGAGGYIGYADWTAKIREAGLYLDATAIPEAGDLVFLDLEENAEKLEREDDRIDHAGVLVNVRTKGDAGEALQDIMVLTANANGLIESSFYNMEDSSSVNKIAGYAKLPRQPQEVPAETEAVTEAPAETEVITEAPAMTEAVTEAPAGTEAFTEASAETEGVTETLTEMPAETESVTEAPTEMPAGTESDTEAPTETPAGTEAVTETSAGTEAGTELSAGTAEGMTPPEETQTDTEALQTDMELSSETDMETEMSSEEDVETETDTEVSSEEDTETETDTELTSETEMETGTELSSETDTETEMSSEEDIETETGTEMSSETDMETESDTDDWGWTWEDFAGQDEEESETEEWYDWEDETEPETEGGDPEADVETSEDWEASVADVELTGIWADDLTAVAQTQLGTKESTENYRISEDGVQRGITRYGQWYGEPYGDWDAMFVSFCLNYAEVPHSSVPRAGTCTALAEMMKVYDAYAAPEEYEASKGDLVFLDTDADEEADHVGILAEVTEDGLSVIAGDVEDEVKNVTYAEGDAAILGYGILPQKPNPRVYNKTYNDGKVIIKAEYTAEAQIPENAILVAREMPQDDEVYQQRFEALREMMDAETEEPETGMEEAPAEAVLPDEPAGTGEETPSILEEGQTEPGTQPEETEKELYMRIYDIGFFVDEQRIDPQAEVKISIEFLDDPGFAAGVRKVICMEEGKEPEALGVTNSMDEVSGQQVNKIEFSAKSF